MKTITIAYWNIQNLIPEFKHNCQFEYSIEKQNEIVQKILDRGLSAMLRPNLGDNKDTLLIYIDMGRFGQS